MSNEKDALMFFKLDRKTISDVSSRELVSNAFRPGMPAPPASRRNMAAPDYGVPLVLMKGASSEGRRTQVLVMHVDTVLLFG